MKFILKFLPQPYKNIVTFFLSTLENVNEKEELERIGKLFADILEDGSVTVSYTHLTLPTTHYV